MLRDPRAVHVHFLKHQNITFYQKPNCSQLFRKEIYIWKCSWCCLKNNNGTRHFLEWIVFVHQIKVKQIWPNNIIVCGTPPAPNLFKLRYLYFRSIKKNFFFRHFISIWDPPFLPFVSVFIPFSTCNGILDPSLTLMGLQIYETHRLIFQMGWP